MSEYRNLYYVNVNIYKYDWNFFPDILKQRIRPKDQTPDLGGNEIFDPETTKEKGK